MVTGDPNRSNNFEAAVAFLATNIASQKTKNQGKRSIAALITGNDNSNSRSNSRNNSKGRDNGKGHHKKWQKSKFDKKNPGKYYNAKEWGTLSKDEMKLAREDREAKGIKTTAERRVVKQLERMNIDSNSDAEDEPEDVEMADAPPLKPPSSLRRVQYTQRVAERVVQESNKKQAKNKS